MRLRADRAFRRDGFGLMKEFQVPGMAYKYLGQPWDVGGDGWGKLTVNGQGMGEVGRGRVGEGGDWWKYSSF